MTDASADDRARRAEPRRPQLVGRDAEFSAITEALGQPGVVLVAGEAGVGKTRLVDECLKSTPARNHRYLVATCPPLRAPFPLGPIVDGLRRLRDRLGPIELSPLGGALRPLFPEWAPDLPPALEPLDDPQATRHQLFRALTELVQRLGVETLVIDDAHLADSATLEWLLTLSAEAGMPRGYSPLLLLTYRPQEVPEGSLLRRLTARRLPSGKVPVRMDLEPLTVAATGALVASMFATDQVSEPFASFLHTRTDGLPLAVEELCRLLSDRHDIFQHDGQWTRRVLDELRVPASIRDSVLDRVERVDPATRQILQAAAIIAQPASGKMLITVADLDERVGWPAIDASIKSGLLQASGSATFGFRHVLDAEAVGDSISVSDRQRMHAQAAAELREQQPVPVVALSRHARAAGDLNGWCRYAEAAADLAWESGDDHTAVNLLVEVLSAAPLGGQRRAELAIKMGEMAVFGAALLPAELSQAVMDALREALTAADTTQTLRGQLGLLVGRLLWETGPDRSAFAAIEAAIPDLGNRPDLAARAMLILATPFVPDVSREAHLHWVRRADGLASMIVSPTAQLGFQANRAVALLLLGEEGGWRTADEVAAAQPHSLVERHIRAGSLVNRAECGYLWGRYEDTRVSLAAAFEQIRQTNYQRIYCEAVLRQCFVEWQTGSWINLRESASRLLDHEDSRPMERLRARQLISLLDLVSGKPEEAKRQLGEHLARYAEIDVVSADAMLCAAQLARICPPDAGATASDLVTTQAMQMLVRKDLWLWATDVAPVHVDALIRIGRLDEARVIVGRFAAWLQAKDVPAAAAALQTCRALLAADGSPDTAAQLFDQAARTWAALPRPYDELLALERSGQLRLSVGDRDAGLAVLSDAQQRFTVLGARWDADRLARLLRDEGIDVARPWRGGRRGYGDHLSPRELEVVRLVAQGLTNRQVAQSLYVSPRTVDHHIRSAMRKLDVPSRTALSVTAATTGLLSEPGMAD